MPAVAHEDLHAVVAGLHIHRDVPAGMLGGVGHGLAGGLQQRVVPGQAAACPHGDHVDVGTGGFLDSAASPRMASAMSPSAAGASR